MAPSERLCDEDEGGELAEEGEEEDVDFNPFLFVSTPQSEASSSLSSEDDLPSSPKRPCISPSPPQPTEDDAICRRTRARHSLADYSLEDLEAYLQESDDDEALLLHQVDDQEEYRKFLDAVLGREQPDHGEAADDDEEDNDVDFEIEIEEALESDDEITNGERSRQEDDHSSKRDGHRPETRQKKLQKNHNKMIGIASSSLRPILPSMSTVPSLPPPLACTSEVGQFSGASPILCSSGFCEVQIGQLHCLIHEHVQLLIQLFSLCVLDPSKQCIAAKIRELILEMVDRRQEALDKRTAAYPSVCFDNLHEHRSEKESEHQALHFSSWMPVVNGSVRSVLDVPSLGLVREYLDDVSAAVMKYRGFQIEGMSGKSQLARAPLFPLPSGFSVDESNEEAMEGSDTCHNYVPSPSDFHNKPKKSLAAVLVEKTKKRAIALVPKCLADLSQRFVPLFNPAMFPHKPPAPAVANRILFTDNEDGLLAMGLMEYNNDWGAIQLRFLPCKSKHQIFVRQKNRSSSKAPENLIKVVRRMKTSPLTASEITLISKGLKAFKNDWNSVWRFCMPYRDPSLLPRQWRIACGTQKTYKKSEIVKKKRRAYEAERRHQKNLLNPNISSDKYVFDNGHNSTDENMNGDDEPFVHEAFLAVSKPERFKMSIFGQATILPQTQNTVRVVKLAPGLPPVNLPPSVRVISQSAFKSYHRTLSYSIVRNSDCAAGLHDAGEIGTESRYSKYENTNGHGNNRPSRDLGSSVDPQRLAEGSHVGSEFVHPLLFHTCESNPEYHPNHSSTFTSNALKLFTGQPSQYSSTVHMHERLDRLVELPQSTACSKENMFLQTIEFHPLLQRTENINSSPNINFANCKPPDNVEPMQTCSLSSSPIDGSTACESQKSLDHFVNTTSFHYERENDIDLDIHLYSATNRKGDVATNRRGVPNCISHPHNSTSTNTQLSSPSTSRENYHSTTVTRSEMNSASYGKSQANSLMMTVLNDVPFKSTRNEREDEFLTEIVMEREELSDTDEDMENVEFECEEMDDSCSELESEHFSDVGSQRISTFPDRAMIHFQSCSGGQDSDLPIPLDTCSPALDLKQKNKVAHRAHPRKVPKTSGNGSSKRKNNAKGSKLHPLKKPELELGSSAKNMISSTSRRYKRRGNK